MAQHRVVFVYAAPIPVGHRVEIRWIRRTSKGLFGGVSAEERAAEPIVRDLDTGIEWVSDHAHVLESGVKHPDQPVALSNEPVGETSHFLRGVVRACRVVHIRRFSNLDVQTELLVETVP
jgi:hypothetical protein